MDHEHTGKTFKHRNGLKDSQGTLKALSEACSDEGNDTIVGLVAIFSLARF